MNIRQIKTAIAKFKNANVSIIKDDALRAKAQKLQAKQKGFTLLELLVVITLLATLSTAALVAYDNVGETAQDAAAAASVTTLEGTLRNYRSIVGEYPEQFDSLANADGVLTGGAMQLMSEPTKDFFGQLTIPFADTDGSNTLISSIFESLSDAGLEELQAVTSATDWNTGYVPNLAMNESYGEYTAATVTAGDQGSEIEFTDTGTVEFAGAAITAGSIALSIVPSGGEDSTPGDGVCSVNGSSLKLTFNGNPVDENKALNLISDGLGDDGCDLVIALGVGKEVPGATLGEAVEIGQVPTVGTDDINPKTHYARAIALFQVGSDGSDGTAENGTIEESEIFERARLIAVVDGEGRTIDQIVADATAASDDS